MAIGEVAAKSCNESTYTYIYISIFSTPVSRVYSHCDKSIRTDDDQQNLQSVIDLVNNYCLKTPIETHYHIKEKDQLFPLEKVKSMVDLGVHFDSKLTFRDHILSLIHI